MANDVSDELEQIAYAELRTTWDSEGGPPRNCCVLCTILRSVNVERWPIMSLPDPRFDLDDRLIGHDSAARFIEIPQKPRREKAS